MIDNSSLWKEDLKRFRDEFIHYNVLEHLQAEDDHAFDYLQRAVFYSAFITRKLIDSPGKVSDAVDNYLSISRGFMDENKENDFYKCKRTRINETGIDA